METGQEESPQSDKSITISTGKGDTNKFQCRYDRLLEGTYRKDEIIVFLAGSRAPLEEEIKTIKEFHRQFGYLPEDITVKTCDDCNIPVFLLKAKNIHTVINTEGVVSGSGNTSSTVGEKYSLNFFNYPPFDKDQTPAFQPEKYQADQKKPRVLVAVLDTGVDRKLVDERYLWKGDSGIEYSPCYRKVGTGWNFIADNDKFDDDNPFRHGTIVSQFIINQFEKVGTNRVEIMPLKTHDQNGIGDLFGIICAVHFAISKGANIINASWGFYYYYDMPIPYLQKLITSSLQEKDILFVTAAGNQVTEEDIIARQIYLTEHHVALSSDQLRDLMLHYFYPARLSLEQRNVVTVTTTNDYIASWTQNYSSTYADVGVLADVVDEKERRMKFYVPFRGSKDLISGSSFATAIVTGLIGAFWDKKTWGKINKSKIIELLSGKTAPAGSEKILSFNQNLKRKYIQKGALTKNWGK